MMSKTFSMNPKMNQAGPKVKLPKWGAAKGGTGKKTAQYANKMRGKG